MEPTLRNVARCEQVQELEHAAAFCQHSAGCIVLIDWAPRNINVY
jgi:hypothetical protein